MDDILDSKQINHPQQHFNGDKPLPNSSAILVLGIISIATACMYGVPGLVCGIISLSLYKKDRLIYLGDPVGYAASFRNAHAGYICAIVGVSVSGLMILWLILAIVLQLGNL